MTLIISILAAVTCTIIWLLSDRAKEISVSSLCYMFWGASIMWFVDAIAEYTELRLNYFPSLLASAAEDAFLGLMIIVLALVIWMVILFIKRIDKRHLMK